MLHAEPQTFARWIATDIASYRFARRLATAATDPNRHTPVPRREVDLRYGRFPSI
jgi:hypothetical protein